MAFFASARQSCNLWVMRMGQLFYKIQKGLLIDNKDSEGWQERFGVTRRQFSRGNIFKNICPQFGPWIYIFQIKEFKFGSHGRVGKIFLALSAKTGGKITYYFPLT